MCIYTLEDIVIKQANFTKNYGVTVNVDKVLNEISIWKGISLVFLQAHQAENFIAELNKLANKLPTTPISVLELCVSYSYLCLL